MGVFLDKVCDGFLYVLLGVLVVVAIGAAVFHLVMVDAEGNKIRVERVLPDRGNADRVTP